MNLKTNKEILLFLGIIIGNVPLYSYANDINNISYNDIRNIDNTYNTQSNILSDFNLSDTYLSSSVLNNNLYILGSYANPLDNSIVNKMDMYDLSNNSLDIKASVSINRANISTVTAGEKIYAIGGIVNSNILNTVEEYNPITNLWVTKTNIPTARYGLSSVLLNNKIYCIGGTGYDDNNEIVSSKSLEVYDILTDSWDKKSDLIHTSSSLTSVIVNNNIYCIGDNFIDTYDSLNDEWSSVTNIPEQYTLISNSGSLNNTIYFIANNNETSLKVVLSYNVATDSWDELSTIIDYNDFLSSIIVDNAIYSIEHNNEDVLEIIKLYSIDDKSLSNESDESLDNSLFGDNLDNNISDTNNVENNGISNDVNVDKNTMEENMDEGYLIDTEISTNNSDIYIVDENSIAMSLDTNSIIFNDFSGISDLEKINAFNIKVSSNLPYQLNAYLPTEIQNSDKTKSMDKSILNIKEHNESTYKSFANINEKLVLKENCEAGADTNYGIDIMLKGGIMHEKSVYRTTIQFEVEQI